MSFLSYSSLRILSVALCTTHGLVCKFGVLIFDTGAGEPKFKFGNLNGGLDPVFGFNFEFNAGSFTALGSVLTDGSVFVFKFVFGLVAGAGLLAGALAGAGLVAGAGLLAGAGLVAGAGVTTGALAGVGEGLAGAGV
jgi:hypothetical protein